MSPVPIAFLVTLVLLVSYGVTFLAWKVEGLILDT